MDNEQRVKHDSPLIAFRESLIPELKELLVTIELMFEDPGLFRLRKRHPNHPAVLRFDEIEKEIAGKGSLKYLREEELLLDIAELMVDRVTWMHQHDNPNEFWSFVEDIDLRRRYKSRIQDPNQYHETIAELFVCGWLKAEGVWAKPIERSGFPDVEIVLPDKTNVFVEIKVMKTTSSHRRIEKHLNKANTQLKRASSQHSGLLFFRILRENLTASMDDRIPSDVAPIIDRIRRSLSGVQHKNVFQVIVVWDTFVTYGSDRHSSLFYMGRTFHSIEHTSSLSNPHVPARFHDGGRSVAMKIEWDLRAEPVNNAPNAPIASSKAIVSSAFQRASERAEGLRVSYALDTLLNPDMVEEHKVLDGCILLATRRPGPNPKSTILIFAFRPPNQLPEIRFGYELFDLAVGVMAAKSSPTEIFDRLLRKYGLLLEVEDQKSLLFKHIRVVAQVGKEAVFFRVDRSNAVDGFANAIIRFENEGVRTAHVYWAHTLNRTLYRSDLLKYRSRK